MTLTKTACPVPEPRHDPHDAQVCEFQAYLRRSGMSEKGVLTYTCNARHFLHWLRMAGLSVRSIDDQVLRRFRDHHCTCARFHVRWCPGRNRYTARVLTGIRSLLGYLEQNGMTPHPGEREDSERLLNDFTDHLSEMGYSKSTRKSYRSVAGHLLTWLHQSRHSTATLDRLILNRFVDHDCLCPGRYHRMSDNTLNRAAVHRFAKFLVSAGMVSDACLIADPAAESELPEFANWLRRHRGIQRPTIDQHVRQVCGMLHHFEALDRPDVKQLRDVLLCHFQSSSGALAGALAGSARMYLRFLAASGRCAPELTDAVPSIRKWRLSALPRYLEPDQIERIIESCNPANPAGLRDRAMFLLLARLGLRAGDIMALRLDDIDWVNARIRVCGKSRRAVALPLPQDAGDAVLEYVMKSRPRTGVQRVFATAVAPYRAFSNVCTISSIVSKALRRAGIETAAARGAHLFRHSAATALVRDGATLDQVQTLLRHRSSSTTAIYAKVDLPMLQSIVQPWPGGEQ